MAVTSDAVRGLKEWQRDRGRSQERALRELQRAVTRLERLQAERASAEDQRDRALVQLAGSGITADDAARFLAVDPECLAPPRRPSGQVRERSGG